MSDKKQQSAIAFGDGAALILAGPGAGKTYTVTRRVRHLVRHHHVPPEQILVITFTKAAAEEMRQRYLALSDGVSQVFFGTFHSFFLSVLKEELHITNEDIIDAKTKRYLLEKTVRKQRLSVERIGDFFQNIEKEIGYVKNADIVPIAFAARDLTQEEFGAFFADYEKAKEDYGKIDFDDMLLKVRKLFAEDAAILEKWQKRYSYFMIDEAQDMNDVQRELMLLLAAPQYNLCFVGDDDQSIYGFRAANPAWMLDFQKGFPSAATIVLDRNYRSAPEIVAAAKRLIRHNEKRLEKNYAAVNVCVGKVRYHAFASESEEAAGLCEWIYKERKEDREKTIAVLFRNHAQSAAVVRAFKKEALAYHYAEEKKNPYQKDIYWDVISYFALAGGEKRRADVLRVMNRPNRFLPRTGLENETFSFAKWKAYHEDSKETVCAIEAFEKQLEIMGRLSSFAAWNLLLKGMGYEAFIRSREADMLARHCDAGRTGGIGQHILAEDNEESAAEAMRKISELAKRLPHKREFLKELRGMTEEKASVAATKRTRREESPPIRLLSFHGAKGLEFDHVYIIDACEGITPSKRAKTAEALEEERRLFYVAVTRAKTELTITTIEKRGGERLYPSRFIKEMSKER